MLQAIVDNAGTILVSLMLIGIVAAAIMKIRRDRKQGKSSCSHGCSNCALHGQCHMAQTKAK